MYGRKNFSYAALAALLVIALGAGVAWASLEIWSEDVPAGEMFVADCVLSPGSEGATVYGKPPSAPQGGRGYDDVDFSVGFADGDIFINGEYVGTYDEGAYYLISVTAVEVEGQWIVDIAVRDHGTGQDVGIAFGESMPEKPTAVVAEAGDISDLDVFVP